MQNWILLLFAFSAILNYVSGVSITIDMKNSYIRVQPVYPLFGDEVRVVCRMVAPIGYTFYRTEPKVAFYNSTLNGYADTDEIGNYGFGDLDRNKYSITTYPDGSRINTSFVVVIKDFCLFDVGLKISCINRLHSDINFHDKDTILSTILRSAAIPPPATNLCIRLPTNTLLTCQSLLSVTWDEVPDSLTDRPIESYRVSLNLGGDTRIVSSLPSNQSVFSKLDFGGNGIVQAEIECVNKAGNSTKVKSNYLEIYRPQIVNLTAELINDRSMVLINWEFDDTKTDWLLDICYKLSIEYELLNKTETTFYTSLCLPSHTTEYILMTTLATNEHIRYVTLTRLTICNQKPYINNSKSAVPFENIPTKIPKIPKINKTTNITLERLNILKIEYSHLIIVCLIMVLTILLFMCILCCCCCCYYKRKGNNREVELRPIPDGELGLPNPIL